jgi:hypothetical protein
MRGRASWPLLFLWVLLGGGGSDRRAGADIEGTPSVVSLDYQGDHGVLLAKEIGWEDPQTPAERAVIAMLGPEVVIASGATAARPISQTWRTTLRALVVVDVGPTLAKAPEKIALIGRSAVPGLSMISTAAHAHGAAALLFDVTAAEKLPDRIALISGEVRWLLQPARGRPIPCGRTTHTVLVTAGRPRPALSWPMRGRGDGAARVDHNAFTVARLKGAVEIAAGVATATAAAEKAWQAAIRHYEFDADPDVNPWRLLLRDAGGQCMTTASFIEAVVNMLGFSEGAFVDVYPAFKKPDDPRAVVYAHPIIRGAYTVEAPEYDASRQFRKVVAASMPTAGGHSAAEAARHRGRRGFERLKFRDVHGELHNYASAFVVEERGQRSYFGGGYATVYHDAVSFLAGACLAVVWTYDEGDDDWESICDRPGPAYWWATGLPFSTPK